MFFILFGAKRLFPTFYRRQLIKSSWLGSLEVDEFLGKGKKDIGVIF
jgi:hypothetical protein